MNTKTLQKHYPKLSASERLALLIAAAARGDEAERYALLDSAPRLTFTVPHTYGLMRGFTRLALWHVASQLETAWTMAVLAHMDDDQSFHAVLFAAYRFCMQADAWRAFCGEMGVKPDDALRDLPGAGLSLGFAEALARQTSPAQAEAEAYLKKQIGDDAHFQTVESLTAQLREALRRHADGWQ